MRSRGSTVPANGPTNTTRILLATLLAALLLGVLPGSALASVATARFAVSPTEPPEHMWGEGWQSSASLSVTVEDPSTDDSPDFTTTLDANADGDFEVYDLPFDFEAGQTVTVFDGTTTKDHVVIDLAVEEIDAILDHVHGRGAPNSFVTVSIWSYGAGHSYDRTVPTDGDGLWTADFLTPVGAEPEGETYNIEAGTEMWCYQMDAEGDQTQVDARVPAPRFEIRPDGDWICGDEWPADTAITVSADDPGAAGVEYVRTLQANGDGWFEGSLQNGSIDIAPGHVITVTDGTATKSTAVTDLSVTGVDQASSEVTGTAQAGAEVKVAVWERGDTRRDVTAAGDGSWTADFSVAQGDQPAFTFVPGAGGGAWQEDIDGDSTMVDWRVPNSRFKFRAHNDELECQDWDPNETLTVTADDPGTGPSPDYQTTVQCNGDGWYEGDIRNATLDIAAGHVLSVGDGETTKTMTVTGVEITGVDDESDTVTGTAEPGSTVYVYPWVDGGSERVVTADTGGVWEADFGEPQGENPAFAIGPGAEGEAVQRDPDDDETAAKWGLADPRMRVESDNNAVAGEGWTSGDNVDIELDDPGTGADPDFATTADVDGEGGFWRDLEPLGAHVEAGWIVSVSDDVVTKTHVVRDVAVTGVDADTDQVSGTAAPGSTVEVEVFTDEWTWREVTANSSGVWSVDFTDASGPEDHERACPLEPGMEGCARQKDDDRDETSASWRAKDPMFRVEPKNESVSGEDWVSNGSVRVTADDLATAPSPDFDTTVESDGYGEFRAEFGEMDADIKAGWVVTVDDGTTNKSHTVTSLRVLEVDTTADTVSGTGGPAPVVVRVWGPPWPMVEVTPEAGGAWTADFSASGGLDDYSEGGAFQADADGDKTMIDWRAGGPRFGVEPSHEGLDGSVFPVDTWLTITIERPATPASPDYQCTEKSDDWGGFDFGLEEDFDIQAGDIVTVSGGGATKVHTVTAVEVTGVDAESSIVTGTAEPDSPIGVYAWGDEGERFRDIVASGAGTWTADFSTPGPGDGDRDQTMQLRVGDGGDAVQTDPDGDMTRWGWEITSATTLGITAPTATSGYGAKVSIRGTLRDPGGEAVEECCEVALYTKAAGSSTWTRASDAIWNASLGQYTADLVMRRNTYVQMRFAGENGYLESESAIKLLKATAYITTPSAGSRMSRTRYYTAYGYLKPRHTSGSSCVKIQCYRNESGRWRLKKTYSAKASTYSTTTSKYSGRVRLPYRGKWRIRAYHSDTSHVAKASGYKYVTVK